MKIKLTYPKIPDALHCPLKSCFAFEKIDGTNIHWVWNSEFGFHDFGTRRDRFINSDAGWVQFHQAHPRMDGLKEAFQKIQEPLGAFLSQQYPNVVEVIIFTEFHGANSFAGMHEPKDEKKLTIFDVQVDGEMLAPEQFIKLFGAFDIPKVLFEGKFTGQLFVDVRNGKYPVKEGVVVKGVVYNEIYMAKIKTDAYCKKLMETFKGNWTEYWE